MADEEKTTNGTPEGGEGAESAGPGEPAKPSETDQVKGMPDWIRFPLVLAVVCAASALGLAGVYALTKENIDKAKGRKVTGAFGDILAEGYSEEKTETFELERGGDLLKRFAVRDAQGTLTAHAGVVRCPGSYNASEPIQLVVVLSPDLERVLGIRVAKSSETPGLGERIKESPSAKSLLGMVAGRPARERLVVKGEGAFVGTVEKKDGKPVAFIDSKGKKRELKKGQIDEGEVQLTRAPFPPAFLDQFTGVPVERAKLKADAGAVDAITGATISSRAVVKGVSLAAEELREAGK